MCFYKAAKPRLFGTALYEELVFEIPHGAIVFVSKLVSGIHDLLWLGVGLIWSLMLLLAGQLLSNPAFIRAFQHLCVLYPH